MDAQKALLASLLADIPMGSILILESDENTFSARSFGQQMDEVTPTSDFQYLLDGQQRLTCLYYFLCDPIGSSSDWRRTIRNSYGALKYRWALTITHAQDSPDPFGLKNLHFEGIQEEPQDLVEITNPLRIKLTDISATAIENPEWLIQKRKLPDWNEGGARYELANQFARRNQLPLWEVADPPDELPSLHKMVLDLMAEARMGQLRAETGPISSSLERAARSAKSSLAATSNGELTRDAFGEAVDSMGARWQEQVGAFIDNLGNTDIPGVVLAKGGIEKAIPIFEVMNQGGTTLSTFDLIVARMARHNPTSSLSQLLLNHLTEYDLALSDALWDNSKADKPNTWTLQSNSGDFLIADGALTNQFQNALLDILSILVTTRNVSVTALDTDDIKRKAILNLTPKDINGNWKAAAGSLVRAYAFLNFRCGVRKESDLRNKLILLPLAFILSDNKNWVSPKSVDRLEFWYWATVLSGTYTQRQSENCIRDIKDLDTWINGSGSNPFEKRGEGALNAPGYSDLDTLLRLDVEADITSDVGKYLAHYVLSNRPVDLLDTETRLEAWNMGQELELHHIIPLAEAKTLGSSTQALRGKRGHLLNSPLNQTYILKSTNRELSSTPVREYFSKLSATGPATHFLPIESEAYDHIEDDETGQRYQGILSKRYHRLRSDILDQLNRLKE